MNRRTFIQAACAGLAALLVRFPAVAKEMPKRHIFWFEDCGETYWYSALNEDEALAHHQKLIVEPSGEPSSIEGIEELDDDEIIPVLEAGPRGETVTLTARQWADKEDGFIATTAGF